MMKGANTMGFCISEIYPKVVAAHSRQTLYFRLEGEIETPVVARLTPMEVYGVSHYPDYWSHHADRYLGCRSPPAVTACGAPTLILPRSSAIASR